MLRFDHLAVSAETLADGVAYVEQALGLALAGGGQHPLMATHNRLLGLGDLYLEVIAADPDAPRPAHPRWFDLPEDDVWPPGILNQELHAFYNPEGSIPARSLVDFNSGHEERGICTLPYVRQRDGSTVYMPVNIMGNLYASNGMSAGNSAAEARTQALSEVFERHIKARIIGEGLCLPDVPEAVIKRYPRIAAGVAALRAEGFGILVKDASLGGQYPVLNMTLLHPQDQGCLTSFGAHPRFEVALERALTELLQGRALDSLKGFAPPTFDLEEAASASNIERHFVDSSGKIHWNFLSEIPHHVFVDWNFSTTTTQDYVWLISKIHEEGFDIYISDLEHLGVYGCRILVPGMSEIYPVDDLDFENNSMANPMREAILNLSDLGDDECEDLLARLNESSLPDSGPVAAAIGMVADAGSFWADLRVGELKTLLGLESALPQEGHADYQTVGGLMVTQLARIPTAGDYFDWSGWRFEVVDMDKRRVDKVLVARAPVAVKTGA